MIRIICGGKKNQDEYLSLINEYERRLRRPFDISWEFVEEERLLERLDKWPYTGREFVICCDERGKNISSDEYSLLISNAFLNNKDVVILIGGAFGFTPEIREKADFVWSFSKLVFPHRLFRLMVVEQIYRAWEINRGSHYHHA